MKVAAIVDSLPGPGSGFIDWSNTDMTDKSVRLNIVLINAKNGRKDSLIDGLKDLRSENPELKWKTLSEAMNDFEQSYIQRWILFITVLGIIFIILIFGIINTLNNYIHSKRREYAILRVISLTPSNILKTIIIQVILYLIIGIIVGTISGVIFLLALLVTSHEEFLIDFRILGYEILLILLFCTAFIIPTGLSISRKKITEELVR